MASPCDVALFDQDICQSCSAPTPVVRMARVAAESQRMLRFGCCRDKFASSPGQSGQTLMTARFTSPGPEFARDGERFLEKAFGVQVVARVYGEETECTLQEGCEVPLAGYLQRRPE